MSHKKVHIVESVGSEGVQIRDFNKVADRLKQRPVVLVLAMIVLLIAADAEAYVGPGAGFAFISSFFFLIATFFLALFLRFERIQEVCVKSKRLLLRVRS